LAYAHPVSKPIKKTLTAKKLNFLIFDHAPSLILLRCPLNRKDIKNALQA